MGTMRWTSQFAAVRGPGTNIGSLFVVAVMAYLLGIFTSPALPLLASIKDSHPVLETQSPQPTLTSDNQQQQLQQQQQQLLLLHQSVLQEIQHDNECKNVTKVSPSPGSELIPTDLVTFYSRCKPEMPQEKVRKFLIQSLYDGVSPFENFPPKQVVPLLQKERIRGWGSSATVFRRLMTEVKPRVVIELGSFLGASATHLGLIAKELGLTTDILCVDDFRGWPGFRAPPFEDILQQNGNVMLMYQFMQNVVQKNLTETILPYPFATGSSLSSFCDWGIYADLIEVDASHDFHSAFMDINLAYALLRPGGVMFGHDYKTGADRRGVRRAVDLFAKRKKLRVEPDGQHWILREISPSQRLPST